MTTWYTPAQISYPWLFRWITTTPSGDFGQQIAISMPEAGNNGEFAAAAWGWILGAWWAPAATTDSQILSVTAIPMFPQGMGYRNTNPSVKGQQLGATAQRHRQAVMVAHSGHVDNWSKKRYYWPGTPVSHTHDDLMDRSYYGRYQELARGFVAAMGLEASYSLLRAYIFRPANQLDTRPEYRTIGLRPILSVRVCTYLDEPAEALAGF